MQAGSAFAAALPAFAAARDARPLADCVSLSQAHQGTRANSNSQLLLKDGNAYYRVGFNGSCDVLARSSSIQIVANGQDNQLCPEGTAVRSRNQSCKARSVELIEAETYERQARVNRR